MSKKGKRQNRVRRAAHAPQVTIAPEHKRLLAIFRDQQLEAQRRGESQPFEVWLMNLRGAASNFNTPVIQVGTYGEFSKQGVLQALDQFEGTAAAPVDFGNAQVLRSVLEEEQRIASVVTFLEQAVGEKIADNQEAREWLRLFVAQFEDYDLRRFAQMVSVLGLVTANSPLPIGLRISSLPPLEAADIVIRHANEQA